MMAARRTKIASGAALQANGQDVQHIATLAGAGWLRTRGLGSSTARYQFTIWRLVNGPNAGRLVAGGTLTAELSIIVEARSAGRASLVLDNGEPVAVEIDANDGDEASFTVIGGVPGF